MSSESEPAAPPTTPPPSVFISYAAEDRAAARVLRDTLASAGLDVWYDESELGGGDAWDQKIRRQIRDCEYFMPVISANTEARKEGYFRREWRLATERTLDMADDVLFLLPVALDDTSELGARVPEKFLSVQWLRVPGGKPTPSLMALLERLRAGDHHALPRRPAGTTRAPFPMHRTTVAGANPTPTPAPPPAPPPVLPPAGDSAAAGAQTHVPPPMPAFPPVPEQKDFFHGVKFLAEVLWWALTAAWSLFIRLPKPVRIILGVWIIISLFSVRCSRKSEAPANPPPPHPTAEKSGAYQKKMRQALERAAASGNREGAVTIEGVDLGKIAAEVADVFREGFADHQAAAGKALVVIPFAAPDATTPGAKFAHEVFLSLFGRLSLERRGEVGVVSPLRSEPIPAVLLSRANALGARFVLAASPVADGDEAVLAVKLFSVAESAVVWSESYPVKDASDAEVAGKIAAAVMERVPRKDALRKK